MSIASYEVDFSAIISRDQLGNAVSWSLDQFKSKPVYLQVLQAFVAEANELYVAVAELGRVRTVFGASGVWLDGIGRIVGQPRELTPVDVEDTFFYWDDDLSAGYSVAVPTDTTAHFMDNNLQWVTDASVNANSVPTDEDYRQQIIRRIFQNMNQYSSAEEIRVVVNAVLGIDCQVWRDTLHSVIIRVPTSTPDWMVYYITAKSFDTTTGTYNRWWFPFPACTSTVTVSKGAFVI